MKLRLELAKLAQEKELAMRQQNLEAELERERIAAGVYGKLMGPPVRMGGTVG